MNPIDLAPLRRATGLVLLGALVLGGTAGCSPTADSAPRTAQARKSPPAGAPTVTSTATDVGWVQLMTPMNQQAVKLLALAAERAGEPRVRDFAERLRTGQEAELVRLRALLTRMGLPGTDVHAGHDMPGMVTVRDLEAARATEGPAFDRLVLVQIRDHLRQSAQVSRSEITSGGRADARELAAALVTARETSLAELERLPGAVRALG
ncbi:hypothetical protein AMK14_17765 [Streptomyces sp. TSRI0445]|uniref:DUF305 domain-containing protein n=1 Tax=Streptomyces TaxID=1883 RepID=UPI0005C95C39|nr:MULTISPECIES: DUF305 domain-containing protein [Streptomyces]PPA38954.1 DUF305 domain-containing protein [Streptomyces griseus]RAN16359.1 DUF305 domain-containing protein [Streptomyces badius]AWL85161.1 DUF305 domain-containing protein [Streptomyces globisporus]OKI68014.1 hypothetical protein AMK14_17765 [Streptomyces sp. TSRI0445]RAN24215.1 DUF305 domain-containing protein [Streptomyces badius]